MSHPFFMNSREASQHPREGTRALSTQAGEAVQTSCQVCYTNMHTGNCLGNLGIAFLESKMGYSNKILIKF